MIKDCNMETTSFPKIVIIGAGIAGLTIAHRLKKHGIKSDIFEARNRVGGRIHSAIINGNIDELGGKNIYDGGSNPVNIKKISKECNLEIKEFTNPGYIFGLNQKDKLELITDLLNKSNIDFCSLEETLKTISFSSKNMAEVLNKLIPGENKLKDFLSLQLSVYEGDNVENLSTKCSEGLLDIIRIGRNSNIKIPVAIIKGGNSLLPKALANNLGNQIHLNQELIEIKKNDSSKFELNFLETKNLGYKKEHADIVILAIPAGVYQDINFSENVIPKNKLGDILKIRQARHSKILLSFAEDQKDILASDFLINDNQACVVDKFSTKQILYFSGKLSSFSEETVEDTYQMAMNNLEKCFDNKSIFKKNNCVKIATDDFFQTYDTSIGYSWPEQKYSKGSYSFLIAGQDELMNLEEEPISGESIRHIFTPVENLFFAGEHTSILSEIGTMESACESGERIVRIILAHLNSEKRCY